ncbi:MAG: DUF3850 domain-containing protein [Candidatus Sabulitectum sp.]|nr:DUF3850 domain-containing protein [Candidatus Sabulitectum sp.]
MKHLLKIENNYLDRLKSGKKRAEVRWNDRDYQLGDVLQFRDHRDGRLPPVGDPEYYIYFRVTHIHSGLGLLSGYVLMSVERMASDEVCK